MALLAPTFSIALSQRRQRCVLDPVLLLTPQGLLLSKQLGDMLELWVACELWQILDNTHFYLQHPFHFLLTESLTTPETVQTTQESQAALAPAINQALRDWEQVRLEADLAGLKLYWIGDALGQSLLPEAINSDIVQHYEAMACTLEAQTQATEAATLPLSPVFRDTVAAAAALDSAFILTSVPDTHSSEPLICQALQQAGLQCQQIDSGDRLATLEREYLQALLVQAGLAKLLWSNFKLAVVHLMLPNAMSFQLQEHRLRNDLHLEIHSTDAWSPPTENWSDFMERNTINPWERAQVFWFSI